MGKRRSQAACEMLVAAWEDPDNKDSTLDAVEDERTHTIEEKIFDVNESLVELKEKLGLTNEADGSHGGHDEEPPMIKIKSVAQRLEFLIDRLGIEYTNLKPTDNNQTNLKRQFTGIKYKVDEHVRSGSPLKQSDRKSVV